MSPGTPDKPHEQRKPLDDAVADSARKAVVPEYRAAARRRRFLIAYMTLLATALSLALLAHQYQVLPGDLYLARALQSIHNPAFAWLMYAVSAPGYAVPATALVLLVAAFLFMARRPVEAIFVLATFSAPAASWAVKLAVGRPRPNSSLIDVTRMVAENSFPSGHVVFYTVFFGFLFYLTYVLLRRSIVRTLLFMLFAAMIVMVGPSRVYLGAHWPSDVAGGYIIGALVLLALIWLYEVVKRRVGSQR